MSKADAWVDDMQTELDRLKAELAAERKRREDAETDAQRECDARLAAITRAEAAERDATTWRQACAQVEARAEESETRLAEALALAERQDAAHMTARAALPARAEQAERERDEARAKVVETARIGATVTETLGKVLLVLGIEEDESAIEAATRVTQARERAEADNATLMGLLRPLVEAVLSTRQVGDGSSLFLARDSEPGPEVLDASALESLLAACAVDHPGAAMLERMRVLETSARVLLEHKENARRYDPSVAGDWKALADALEPG